MPSTVMAYPPMDNSGSTRTKRIADLIVSAA